MATKKVQPGQSLFDLRPDIALEWHPSLNESITPREVTAGSKFKAWWKCPVAFDHEWQAIVQNRTTQGQGCPLCAGRRASSTNNLRAWCRENGPYGEQLLGEFNERLNQRPIEDFTTGSKANIYWNCHRCSEVFTASPNRRTSMKTGCPFCSGHRVGKSNSFASLHQALLSEWDFDRNTTVSPESITAGSNKKVWWKCSKGPDHNWEATVGSRTGQSTTGCPFCSGHRVSVTNSLSTTNPTIAQQWHEEKNGELKPHQLTAGSNTKVWWQCQENTQHVWEMPVVNRTGQNQGCPYCANRRVDSHNSLQSLAPIVASYFDSEKNGIPASEVLATSHKKYWWRCQNGPDHIWRDSPLSVASKNEPCPCCPPRMKQVSVTNSLRWWCSQNSERGQRLLMEWDVDENTALTPDDIIYTNQRKKILWKCPEAFDHVWEKSVYERTVDGTDCPFCNHRRPSSTNNLLDKYPEVARLLHPTLNKEVDISTIAPNSHVKLWWKCPNGDDHVWQSTPNSMKGQPQCGFCNGKRVSVTNSLATRFPEIAQEFDLERNTPLTPKDVTFGSGKKYWWRCVTNSDHSWSATASSRTGKLKTGCPECIIAPRSRREISLAHEIGSFFEINQLDHRVRESEKTFDCDIILRNERVIVEYDGSYWHKHKQEVDTAKTQSLVNAGWKVIRVREEPLSPIQSHDVLCLEYEPVVGVAARVLRTISNVLGISITGLVEYESTLIPRATVQTELFIEKLLSSPDAVMAYRQRQSWDRRFHELEEFSSKTGLADPAAITDSPRKLITWVNKQRVDYLNRSLSEELSLRLEKLPGWHWSQIDSRWRNQFDLLRSSIRAGLDLSPSQIGVPLVSWITNQRKLFRLNQLNEEQVELLSEIPNWSWEPEDEAWQKSYEALVQYVSRTGDTQVPQGHKEGTVGLGVWVNKQRIRFRKKVLETERQQLLESLPGWTWKPSSSKQESMFMALDAFVLREGHANVPATHVEDGIRLGQWLNGIRTRKRRGALHPDLINRLSSIPTFSWEPLNEQVPNNVELLEEYFKQNPEVKTVRGVIFNGRKLNSIVTYLRRHYSDGELAPDLIERIEILPNWSWSPFEESWQIGYSNLLTFVDREGTSLVPQKHVENEFNLGVWVHGRRSAFRKGSLNEKQKTMLEALPHWTWNPPRGPQPKSIN